MNKYVKGRWEVNADAAEVVCGDEVVLSFSERFTKKEQAIAARIVACVNACEGIEDPSVIPEVLELLRRIPQSEASSAMKTNALRLLTRLASAPKETT